MDFGQHFNLKEVCDGLKILKFRKPRQVKTSCFLGGCSVSVPNYFVWISSFLNKHLKLKKPSSFTLNASQNLSPSVPTTVAHMQQLQGATKLHEVSPGIATWNLI